MHKTIRAKIQAGSTFYKINKQPVYRPALIMANRMRQHLRNVKPMLCSQRPQVAGRVCVAHAGGELPVHRVAGLFN